MDRRDAALLTAGGALVGAGVAMYTMYVHWQRRLKTGDGAQPTKPPTGAKLRSKSAEAKLHALRETDGQCNTGQG